MTTLCLTYDYPVPEELLSQPAPRVLLLTKPSKFLSSTTTYDYPGSEELLSLPVSTRKQHTHTYT